MARRKRKRCKFFTPAALDRGARIERREHGLSAALARKIARDHLCAKGARAYPKRGFSELTDEDRAVAADIGRRGPWALKFPFGEAWLKDPRLPDRATAVSRRFQRKFPAPPWQAKKLAEEIIVKRGAHQQEVKARVESNRTGTRFWFIATYGPDHDYMADYDSTTSKTKAQGWIDAISKKG